MFYCNECGEKRGWPTDTQFKSAGPCLICGAKVSCNAVSPKDLPKEKSGCEINFFALTEILI